MCTIRVIQHSIYLNNFFKKQQNYTSVYKFITKESHFFRNSERPSSSIFLRKVSHLNSYFLDIFESGQFMSFKLEKKIKDTQFV